MTRSIVDFFKYRPYVIALIITAFLFIWMLIIPSKPVAHLSNDKNSEATLPKVQVQTFTPSQVIKNLKLYAKSEANSRTVLRAEIAGKIKSLPQKKGSYVKNKTALVYLERNEVPERLVQAKALLNERQINYKAAKSLNAKGLQGRARLAEMKSLYLAAKTEVKYLQIQLKRTKISAPFSGILQEQFAEKGDYVGVGDPIFSIENIDPIIIRADVTEHYIKQLKLNETVSATLLSKQIITGKISYISSIADSKTSTFRIEAEFPNKDFNILSGISARLVVPLYPIDAIFVSPSVLALDKDGNLGVKFVENSVVKFHEIELVEADEDGIWLAGFKGAVDIITRGQGFVKIGDRVDAVRDEE